jgi:hypothetical protein
MKTFKLLTFFTIAWYFILGVCCCSVDRSEETQECPYIDSTSESDLRVAYLNRMHLSPPYQKYFGVGMNHGLIEVQGQGNAFYTDINGNKYQFITITTVITNDTTLPVTIKINFSKEYAYPAPYNKQKFKLFLVPIKESMQEQIDHNHISEELEKVLAPVNSSITLSNGLYGTISEETKLFLETYVPSPSFLRGSTRRGEGVCKLLSFFKKSSLV